MPKHKIVQSRHAERGIIQVLRNLKDLINDISPENIPNYNETNFSDDLGTKKLIFKRGTKYP